MTTQGQVFLVGAERSGSTMLRLMLDHHPEIAWQNEFEFAIDLVGDDGSVPGMRRYQEWLAMNRVFRAAGLRFTPGLDYAQTVRDFLEQRRVKSRKPLVGATVHRHFDRLLWFWPDARFIHLVRDPRDVASSVIKMGWAGNCWTGPTRWVDVETLWDTLSARLERRRWITVRYEDLVVDAERELRRLCEFIGVGYEPAMLEYAADTTYERPDPESACKWRRSLSPADVRLVEARVGSLLESRGYESSGHPALHVSAARRRVLVGQDKAARIRFRARRYGVGLQTAAAVSKRLGLRSTYRKCVFRMKEIDREYLQ